ncbi:hypothetical protein [Paenibacillus mucilaginosus]|nr:hypothetical protein [Paenibacillus mucilaginosus]MCG7212091.1 hypothetical protein [Paenibacillus mucilaginosus]
MITAEVYTIQRNVPGEEDKEEWVRILCKEEAEEMERYALKIYQAIMDQTSDEIKLIYRAHTSRLVIPVRTDTIKSLEPIKVQECIMYQFEQLMKHNE